MHSVYAKGDEIQFYSLNNESTQFIRKAGEKEKYNEKIKKKLRTR